MYPCIICRFIPVRILREICENCVEHGQFNIYGHPIVFFVIDDIIYSASNGSISGSRECYINDIPCYASYIKGRLLFRKIKEIPENKTHFKFCTY